MRKSRLFALIAAASILPVALFLYTLVHQRVELQQLHDELGGIQIVGISVESQDIDWTCADDGPKSVRVLKVDDPEMRSAYEAELDLLGFQFDGYGSKTRPRSDSFDWDWVHYDLDEDWLIVTAGQFDRDGCTFLPIYGF